jgi:sterol 3beta-glucosyltransferase
MKIFIVTAGSGGDVQPYVALGKGLKAAGYAVTLLSPSILILNRN